jgi:hypothetical protein
MSNGEPPPPIDPDEELIRRLEAIIAFVRTRRNAAPGATRAALTYPGAGGPVAVAAGIYAARRRREHYFEALAPAFGEPIWDLLLDLFVARCEGRRVSVSSACIAASVPATTALRWLAFMEEQGLLVRESDPADGRRAFVRLADDACRSMERYMTEMVPGAQTNGAR